MPRIEPKYVFVSILVFLAGVLIFLDIYQLIAFNKHIGYARTVRVRNDGKICNAPLGDLPVIPERRCDTEDGRNVRCYQPNPNIDLVFEISSTPFYYRSVCNRLCGSINLNGVCDEDNSLYDYCLNLLEPLDGCNNSANPLGRLTETNSIYYAKSII